MSSQWDFISSTILSSRITFSRGFHDTTLIPLLLLFFFYKCVGVSKNRLEELTGLKKAGILMVMVYYSKMNKLKSAKVKGAWRKVHRKTGTSSRCLLPVKLHALILPAMICDTFVKCYQTGKFTQALVYRVFTVGESLSHRYGITHLTDLSCLNSNLQRSN